MIQRTLSLLFATVVCFVGLSAGCVDEGEVGPSEDELEQLDTWVETSGGKADLPTAWNDLVAYVRNFYRTRMTAIWDNQEHPATASAAIDRTRQLLRQAGINDPNSVLYPTTVQRMRVEYFDHSEIDIVLARGRVVRLVGDSHGAGAYFDDAVFEETIGTKLCLTWSELQTAIEASYLGGDYATDFVCHTVTEKVLRALDVGSRSYANQLRTYTTASWVWGPLLPNWSSRDPNDWDVSRACPAR